MSSTNETLESRIERMLHNDVERLERRVEKLLGKKEDFTDEELLFLAEQARRTRAAAEHHGGVRGKLLQR